MYHVSVRLRLSKRLQYIWRYEYPKTIYWPFLHWRLPPSQQSQRKRMHAHPLAAPPPQLWYGTSNPRRQGRAGTPAW